MKESLGPKTSGHEVDFGTFTKEEREAFAGLKNDEAFKDAKWKYFLKAAILPIEQVEKSLTAHLDPKTDADKINMIKNSMWNRMGQLKQKSNLVSFIHLHHEEASAD